MNRIFLIRALSLYAPLLGCLMLWSWRKPVRAEATGALLATAWNLPMLLALNSLAQWSGWWRFNVHEAVFLGTPTDLWLGWSFLWGTFAVLLFRHAPVWLGCFCFGACDLLIMPLCSPVISLGRSWLLGETLGLAFCLAPAFYFARWTREKTGVGWRVTFQFLTFSGLFILGIAFADRTKAEHLADVSRTSHSAQALLQLLFLLSIPALSAVQEFAQVGNGTPLPYDPPTRLVTTGVYSYIANPMQTTTTVLLFTFALGMHSLSLFAAGFISIAYCVGLAAWDEGSDLRSRFGFAFLRYRRHVRNWFPRWRPYVACSARIYLSQDCHKCSQIAAFLCALKPYKLCILPAEEHPLYTLERMTYESHDGSVRAQGIVALARALEHVNLAWALAGFMLRLPLASQLVQSITDVSGGGPFSVSRRVCSIDAAPQEENT